MKFESENQTKKMSTNDIKTTESLRRIDKFANLMQIRSKELTNLSEFNEIIQSIQDIVFATLNKPSKVYFYGSRVIGVADDDSDIDIFVEVNGRSYPFKYNAKIYKKEMHSLDEAFKKNKNWVVTNTVLTASVPIITTKYLPLSIDCKFHLS